MPKGMHPAHRQQQHPASTPGGGLENHSAAVVAAEQAAASHKHAQQGECCAAPWLCSAAVCSAAQGTAEQSRAGQGRAGQGRAGLFLHSGFQLVSPQLAAALPVLPPCPLQRRLWRGRALGWLKPPFRARSTRGCSPALPRLAGTWPPVPQAQSSTLPRGPLVRAHFCTAAALLLHC